MKKNKEDMIKWENGNGRIHSTNDRKGEEISKEKENKASSTSH